MLSQFDTKIVCPVCADPYTHFERPAMMLGGDDYLAWEGRGDAITIPMWCEQDHKWELILGFHKGMTYVFAKLKDTGEILSLLTEHDI